ncbi:MAG: 3'(2'),5'-bisphosphate nucleotidase CysQ [Salaquimonas sp.]
MLSQPNLLKDDLELVSAAAKEAGLIAMKFFGSPNEVWQKHGNSPVSEADFAVDAFLKDALLAARPGYGWLSEETEDNDERLSKERLFVVDPIDGTRGFLAGNKQWCISIGIVENTRPIAGALECPALNEHFTASKGFGAYLNGSKMDQLVSHAIGTITGSRKLNEVMSDDNQLTAKVLPFVPSLAYRLAMVAKGSLDGAVARPGAHDWDLAAAHILLDEAGGKMTDILGTERRYNQPNPKSGSLLASSIPAHPALMKLAKSAGFLH